MTKTSLSVSIVARTTAAGLLVTVLLQAGLEAQGVGRVAGRVQDLAGNPLADVSITVRGVPELDARTDDHGGFVLAPVPDGEYVITATLEAFAPSTRRVRVVNGQTADVTLTLSIQILEQVTVTADRTGERELQKIPMAVSVLSEAQLTQREVHTVADLAGLTPGLTVSQNTGFSQLTIRGIGSTAAFAGSDPSSAVYIDGVYIARPAAVLTEFLDLDRVEVLRGPQGTLYGHNAVGGALNLTTKVPTDDVAFSTRLVVGNFQTSRAEVSASGPLLRGRIMAGASAVRAVSDGSVQDLTHPDRPLGTTDVAAARATVRVLFSHRSELLVRGDYTHGHPTPLYYAKVLVAKPGFTIDNPPDLHEVRTSAAARGRQVHHGASAQFIWRPTPTTVVTSLSALRHFDYDLRVDSDATELNLSVVNLREMHRQLSQEVTLTGERRGITWTSGVFAFKDRDRQPVLIELPSAGLNNTLDPEVEGSVVAAFGQANVPLGSRVGAIVGLRYSHERKTMDNAGGTAAGDHVVASFQYRDTISASAWTPKFGLDYQIDERTLAYVSATRGYKSGGFNSTAAVARGGFAPEWAWTYEAGIKSSPLNQRASSERSGVFHGLFRPAGANSHRSRGARHQERGGGDDSWPRAGGRGPALSAVEAGGTHGLDRRQVRPVSGTRSGWHLGRRRRTPAVQRPGMVRSNVGGVQDPDWRGWRMVVVAGGSHAEHRLFHGDQRSHRTAGPIRSRQRECHGTAASALVDRHFRAQPDRYGLRDRNEQLATARRCCPPG